MRALPRTGLCRLAALAPCVPGLALFLALLLGLGSPASAAPFVRIDRIDAEPSVFDGLTRVQIFATAVDIHGLFLHDLTAPKTWKLRIGSRQLRAPYLLGRFRNVDDELLVAIVVETAAPFAEVLPEITKQLEAFLETLPRNTRILVLGYDDEVNGGRRPVPLARARQSLDLDANSASTEFQLVQAVDQAREALARTRPEVPGVGQRKLIVVFSDGRDVDPSPNNYRAVSRRAGSQGIRIHTVGFPADRNRYPLYGLAEMSKQSGGTFRLALTKGSFASHIEQLGREINDQYVLTYFLPPDQIERKRIQVEARDIVSGDVRVPRSTCGGETCDAGQYCAAMRCVSPAEPDGLGFLGWLVVIAGAAVGLVAALGVAGLVLGRLHRRREQAAAEPGAAEAGARPDAPGEAPAPEAPVVQRVIPQGLHGQPVHVPHAPARTAGHSAQPGMPASGAYPAADGRTGSHAPAPAADTGRHPPAPSAVHRIQPQGGGPAAAPPSLLVLSGPHQGQRIPLHHGFVIGTAPNCHMVLRDDRFASGHHAHVLMDTAGGCTLVDRGSTNGTFVNGVREREKRLIHGMLIKIGSTEARFLSH
jgi:hypothetical protein